MTDITTPPEPGQTWQPRIRARRRAAVRTTLLAALLMLATGGCAPDGNAAQVASEGPTVPTPATTPAPSIAPPTTTAAPSTLAPGAAVTASTTAPHDRAGVRLALQAARDRWGAAAIGTYEHEYAVRCDCAPIAATVRVLGGQALGTVAGHGLELATVGEWFDAVTDAIEAADGVEADFDADFGHPLHVLIDPDRSRTGDEYGLDTVGFHIVHDPIRRWFTESWACGYQLVASTPDQSAALVLRIIDDRTHRDVEARYDVTELPLAELWLGTDLMAGWCDEVPPPDQPAPAIETRWPVAAGVLDLDVERGSTATGDATGLVATTAFGVEVALGSVGLSNDAWGRATH